MSISTSSEELYQEIAQLDAIVFEAYNTCDFVAFKEYFVEDLEFYHDRSGLVSSRKVMLEALKASLCDNDGVRIRRELIKDSLRVYPLKNFGAIQVGEHYYYKSTEGQQEQLFEVAKFTHIWKKEGNRWKIMRVMSYDHQPAEH